MVFMLQAMEILSRVDGYLAVPLDPKTLLVPVLFSSFEQDYSYWCGKSPGEPLIPPMVASSRVEGPPYLSSQCLSSLSLMGSKTAIHSDYKPREAFNEVRWWTFEGADC